MAEEKKDGAEKKQSTQEGAGQPKKPDTSPGSDIRNAQFDTLTDEAKDGKLLNIDFLMDIGLQLSIELGRATLSIKEILALRDGSVVELNKLAGEPVDIYVNNKLIARGEVIVIDDNFGVRVTDILSPAELLKNLKDDSK